LLRTECEREIDDRLEAFITVGYRLHVIKTQKLFRSTHRIFEKYCKEKWGISRVHANRQIDAYQTGDLLKTETIGSVSVPATESQARTLADLTPEDKVKVPRKVKQNVGPRKPTAKDFKQAKDQVCPAKAPQPSPKPPAAAAPPEVTTAQAIATPVEVTPDTRGAVQNTPNSPTVPELAAPEPANIVSLAELNPNAKVLSLTELWETAKSVYGIHSDSSKAKKTEKLLFILKVNLEAYAKAESAKAEKE
jgi:hypothetical protein